MLIYNNRYFKGISREGRNMHTVKNSVVDPDPHHFLT
jgi:hypothetical protein